MHVMIDIETLGVEGKFVVLEVSLFPFYLNDETIIEPITVKFDISEQLNKGFDIDKDTMQWWLSNENTSKMLGNLLISDKYSIEKGCLIIDQYLKHLKIEGLWSTASLDYLGLSNLFAETNIKNPFDFRKRFDARTLRFLNDMFFDPIKIENNHESLKDCENQITILKQQLQNFKTIMKESNRFKAAVKDFDDRNVDEYSEIGIVLKNILKG